MKPLARRIMTLTAATTVALVSTIALTGSTASARPTNNSVNQTAFIWNCPTGVAGCSAEQRRQGDIRTTDGQITDVCRVDNNNMNLVYNRTDRVGAADRTGFLIRSNLQLPNLQLDSCVGDGIGASAPEDTQQLLCPYDTCGSTGDVDADERLLAFCDTDISGDRFLLTVSFDPDTGGPLTAGFIHEDDMNSAPDPQSDCEAPNF